MAGGVGSRFWPASRESTPKQFHDILGIGKSLIQLTFERFASIIPEANIYVVTHEKYKNPVLEHLPALKEEQVICEPSRNNTAPCVAFAAIKIKNLNPEANIIVSPADHIILKEAEFHRVIKEALDFTSNQEAIVTLGLHPTRPDTGYGYIEMGAMVDGEIRKAVRFTEKPKLEIAEKYLDDGNYAWNSGLFIFRATTIIDGFAEHAPEIVNLLGENNIRYNTDNELSDIKTYYPRTPSISIDYAIMEKAANIFTIPADIDWSDLGTWKSLFEECDKDEADNVIQVDKHIIKDTKNSLIRAPKNKTVVVRGLDDYLIIDETDVLLIYPKQLEQDIKQIRAEVQEKFGDSAL